MARAHLYDDDPRVRAAALDSPVVRRRAASLGASLACARQYELLADPDPSVVEVAAWSCGERPTDPVAVQLLIGIGADHEDPLCRESAIAALGALGAPAGLATILGGCTDKPAIRRRAVLALAPFDGPEVDAALVAASEDRDWQTRQAAETLLRPPMPSDGDGNADSDSDGDDVEVSGD